MEVLRGRTAFRKGVLARGKGHCVSLRRGRDASAVRPREAVCFLQETGLVIMVDRAVIRSVETSVSFSSTQRNCCCGKKGLKMVAAQLKMKKHRAEITV